MVAGYDDCLSERFRTPIPEWMMIIVLITEITYVTGKDEHITYGDKRIIFQPTAIFMKLQMEIGCVLNFHIVVSNFKVFHLRGETGGRFC